MGGGGRRLRRRGGIFARSYAAEGRRLARFPRGLALPRLPATPEALLKGLLALMPPRVAHQSTRSMPLPHRSRGSRVAASTVKRAKAVQSRDKRALANASVLTLRVVRAAAGKSPTRCRGDRGGGQTDAAAVLSARKIQPRAVVHWGFPCVK